MKKILIMILALALACGSMFVFASCGDEPVVCNHVDVDKDHKCDECKEDFTAKCVEHVNENNDAKCDYCEAELEVETPDAPVNPEKPETPDAPENPEEPDVPATPDVPEIETPAVPDAPEVPETPDEPTTPVEPEQTPVVPDAPAEPETPAVPETPADPDSSVKPEASDDPETPDVPETPDEPETPEVPDAPETPDAPDAPDAPEVPECKDHTDNNIDKKCDNCGVDYIGACVIHIDRDRNYVCDYCEEKIEVECEVHLDLDGDLKCDTCKVRVTCKHVDINPVDAKCDLCGRIVKCKDCIDLNSDGDCDVCGKAVECETCYDSDGNNRCDVCNARLDPNRGIDATLDAYKNSVPTKIVTNTTVDFLDLDTERTPTYTLNTNRVLITGYIDGKIATVMTTIIDKIKYVSDGATDVVQDFYESIISTEEFMQGLGSRTDGKRWSPTGLNFAPTAKRITPNLKADYMKRVKYYEELYNNMLTFIVEAEDIDKVFGEGSIVSDSDIKVTIVNNGATITSVTIEYSRESDDLYPAQQIVMTTEYSYEIQKVELLY